LHRLLQSATAAADATADVLGHERVEHRRVEGV
jgi:hypothetical protein